MTRAITTRTRVAARASRRCALVATAVIAALAFSIANACVKEGKPPVSPCPADRCAEVYPEVPRCATAVWDADACTCELAPASDDAPCDDGDACTLEDRCDDGACRGALVGAAAYCDDANPCTDDLCDQLL